MKNQLQSLIVDSNKQSRMLLKQAVLGTGKFLDQGTEENLQSAVERLAGERRFDVIFLSAEFPTEELTNCLTKIRSAACSDEAACILVNTLQTDEVKAHEDAILLGGDGSLTTPFSIEKLEQVVALAASVKKNRWAAKEQIRIRRLLPEIMAKLDATAEFRSEGFCGEISLEAMRQACKELNQEETEAVVMYLQQAITEFSEATPPESLLKGKDRYSGSSARVRTKIEKRVISHLEEKLDTKIDEK